MCDVEGAELQREKLKGDAVSRKAPAIPPGSSEARRQGGLP